MSGETHRRVRTASFIGINSGLSVLFILLALATQILLASRLGASREMDVFFAVTGLVAAIRAVVGSSLPQTFVPMFKKAEQSSEPHAPARIAAGVSLGLLAASGAVAVGLMVFAGPVAERLVPGFEAPARELAAGVLRIVAFSIMFDSLRGLVVGFCYAREQFVRPGLSVSFQHVALVTGVFLLYPRYGVEGLGWAWLAGSMAMLIALAGPALLRSVSGSVAGGWHEMRRLSAVGPVFVVALLFELRVPLERLLGSFLGEGAVSYLSYSNRLLQTMYACLPMAIAVTYLPQFSAHAAATDDSALGRAFSEALRIMVLVVVPVLVVSGTLNAPIIATLFERGRFTPETTAAVSSTLVAHLGVFAGLAASAVAYNVFFSRQRVAPLIVVELACLVLFAWLGQFLMARWSYIGIAVAGSIVAILRGVVSVTAAGWRLRGFEAGPVLRCLAIAAFAGTAMWISVAGLAALTAGSPATGVTELVRLMALSAAGIGTYVAVLWWQRVPEVIAAWGVVNMRVRRRFA